MWKLDALVFKTSLECLSLEIVGCIRLVLSPLTLLVESQTCGTEWFKVVFVLNAQLNLREIFTYIGEPIHVLVRIADQVVR
jgi:hypothetical protein